MTITEGTVKSMVSSKAVRSQVLAAIKSAVQNQPKSNISFVKSEDSSSKKVASTKRCQPQELVAQFVSVVEDYKAVTEIVRADQISDKLSGIISGCPIRRLVVPSGINPAWITDLEGIEVIKDDGLMSVQQLAQFDGVITGSSYALASSGTIVLTSAPSEGRRALSLLPDYHFCVVDAENILARALDLFAVYKSDSPLTLISGPSATSDIELSRVEGVHGPRNLFVLVVWDG